MAKIKYVARLNGQIVGTRTSERTYTHAIVLNGHGETDLVRTWCGRLDLAQGEQRKYQRYGFRAEIVPVDIIAPKPARGSKVDAIAAPAEPAAPVEDPAAAPAAAAKFGIENVHVDSVSRPDGRGYAIGWTIGGDRFHVWVKRGEIEDVIYKNPPLHLKAGERGHFETRRLDRTSKASGAIFAEALAIVQRDSLVAKARADDKASIERSLQISKLRAAQAELEAEVLESWRAGAFAASDAAHALRSRAAELEAELAAIAPIADQVAA